MADYILADPEELRARAAQLRSYGESEADIIKRLSSLVQSLDETWSGEAQAAFAARFEKARQRLEGISPALNYLSKIVDAAADKLEQTDTSLQQRIDGI